MIRGRTGQRDTALREIFELTCAMAAYPPMPAFTELHKRIGRAIETEATALAARPLPGRRTPASTRPALTNPNSSRKAPHRLRTHVATHEGEPL